MQMLYAVLTLGGLGLLFGALLALAARFFAVQTDPRVDEIMEALPGANCGACGYTGCAGFAEAAAAGEAPLNGCIPGGSGAAQEIGRIMGKDVGESTPMVATVFCTGDNARAENAFIYDGIRDCAIAGQYGGGFKACAYGCLGLGSCVAVCPFEAITMGPEGLPVVDWNKCTGCGLCRDACPRGIIKILPKEERGHLVLCNSHDRGKAVSQVCQVGCIACQACVKACPQQAIAMDDNLAVIDLAKCDDCGKCVLKCKPGTIHPRAREQSPAAEKAAAS